MDMYAEAFSTGIPSVEVIPIEEDVDYKKYAFSLYERVRKLSNENKTTNTIVEEAIASSSTSRTSISVALSDDSIDSEIEVPEKCDELRTVDFEGENFVIPVFKKTKDLLEWLKVLKHHEKKLQNVINDVSSLEETNKYQDEANRLCQLTEKLSFGKIRDKSKIEMYRKAIYILSLEKYVYSNIGSLVSACGNAKGRIDTNSGGLWISDVDKKHPAFSRLSTRRIALNKIYRFDENMAKNLVKLLFSNKPDVRAYAKLTLSSKTDSGKFSQILSDGGRVLEAVCSEAGLTQNEILHLVFPRAEKGEEKKCITCDIAIDLSQTIYHDRCATVEWLLHNCHFEYDEEERCIMAKEVIYLNAESRRRLNVLLHLHSQLNCDIIQKTEKETIVWKRQANGELIRSQLSTTRDDEIVGSAAWRIKHGFKAK